MNKYVSTFVAGLAGLAIAGSVSAQTNVIRITGSTAFRKATHIAIGNILNAGYVYGYSGSALSSANQAEFRGTTRTGNFPVDIKCSWAGSVGGVQSVVQELTIGSAQAAWLNSSALTTAGASGLTGPYDPATKPDVAMSDSFQSSTAFTSPPLKDQVVGVVPFVWIRDVDAPARMSNVTTLFAQIVLGGQVPLSQMTGLVSDDPNNGGYIVSAVGRDEDSGTRLVEFAESGFGIFGSPQQYQPTISGTPGTSGASITSIAPWPANTVNGISYPVGHSGYSSGGSLALAMSTHGSLGASGGYLLSFVGTSDANTALTNGCGALTYNGVALPYLGVNSWDYTPVKEGSYTVWGYEHLMYRQSGGSALTGTPKTIADQIAKQLHDTDAVQSGVKLSDMLVGRSVEGGIVTFGSPY